MNAEEQRIIAQEFNKINPPGSFVVWSNTSQTYKVRCRALPHSCGQPVAWLHGYFGIVPVKELSPAKDVYADQ